MPHFLLYLLYVAAGLGALTTVGFVCGRFFWIERYPDEIHFAETSDGWRIAVTRYRPRAPRASEPVLLCHGIGANRYNLDLTDDLSLARYLAEAGYDTWLIELRGRGLSTRPRLFSGRHYDWCFDEYVERDIPAAIDAVRRATGAERVHWVGFSMGGMAMYAYLADANRRVDVRSAVALGAPATFRFQSKYLGGRIIRSFRWLRHRFLLRMLAPFSGYWHPAPLRLVHNPENMPGEVYRRAMVNVVCNFSRNELLQFSDWISNDQFRAIDHHRDYRRELERIETPLLLLAGARDLLAPPDSVKYAYDAVASADKRFVICGRAQGFRDNYGHLDLVLGRGAREEIFPLVQEWLDRHADVRARAPSPPAVTAPPGPAEQATSPSSGTAA